MQGNYSVHFESYSERHFIRTFEKKYMAHWDITLRAIIAELERIDALLRTDKAETISTSKDNDVKIVKVKFKIAASKESANSSGNRCIVAWCESKQSVSVLLIYSKTDLRGSNETAEWKKLVRDNYPEYKEMLNN